jgi:hypothetical protein
MPDTIFEPILASQLREYAEGGVRPIDRFAIAEQTIAVGGSDGLRERLRNLSSTGPRPLALLLVGLLILALAASVALVGSRLLTPRPPLPPPHSYLNELGQASNLPAPVGRPVLVPLVDGRVLVIGNDYGPGGDPTSAAYVYDPGTGASIRPGPMVSAEQPVGPAVRLRDGRVLLIGGGVAQIFDPSTLRFAMVGPMVTSRSGANMAVLRDGRVLIAGGMPPGGNPGVDPALRSAELFDPATLTFSATGSMANSQGGGAMATLADGRVFMATNPTAEVYDPSTGTFSAAGAMFGGGGTPIVIADGRVVVFGSTGLNSGGFISVWDPISTTISVSSMPEPLTGATLLDDGRILLIGMCRGQQTGWTGLYDPTTGGTNPGPPTYACRPTSTRLADGRVLIVGGDINGDSLNTVPTVEIFR